MKRSVQVRIPFDADTDQEARERIQALLISKGIYGFEIDHAKLALDQERDTVELDIPTLESIQTAVDRNGVHPDIVNVREINTLLKLARVALQSRAKHTIEPIEYRRDDGVSLLKQDNKFYGRDSWVIRKILGPAFFYDPRSRKWEVVSGLTQEDAGRIGRPFKEAYKIFETVERDDPR
jgi:hypothetical protein